MKNAKLTLEDVHDRTIINKDQLDEELVAQPQLVFDVGQRYCDAMSAKDSFENELKELIAKATSRIRIKLEKGSGGKITVAQVEAAVDADPEVVAARAKEIKLADRARRWDNSMDSIRARGYALHKLCDLNVTHSTAIAGQSERIDRKGRREDADAETQKWIAERKRPSRPARQ